MGSRGSFETRGDCGEKGPRDKKTMRNVTVTPKASCRGWVSVNGINGQRDEWAATRTKISAGRHRGVVVTDESWLFEGYDTKLDTEEEDEAGKDGNRDEEEDDWDWSWEKTTVGTSTAVTGLVAIGLTVYLIVRKRAAKVEENGETYIEGDNVAEIGRELYNIVELTEDGMNKMVKSLEIMAATMEELHEIKDA